MKAAKFYSAKDVRIEEVQAPQVQPGYVVVDIEWVGICGSDMHEYVSGPLNAVPGTILGHEFSATVSEVGEGVTNVKVGDRVACVNLDVCGECKYCKNNERNLCEKMGVDGYGLLGFTSNGAFAEQTLIAAENCIKIPDNLPLDYAALVEPGAVTLHAVNKSKLEDNGTTAIFGAGPIGLLLVIMAKAKKASQIIVVDVAEDRLEIAKKLGATATINPLKEDSVKKIKELTSNGVDVAFEAAGVQPTFSAATKCLNKNGEVMIVALYEKEVSLNLMDLTMLEAKLSNSFCYSEEFPEVIDIYSNNKDTLDLLITKKIILDDLIDEGFETNLHDKTHIKILVTPNKRNLLK